MPDKPIAAPTEPVLREFDDTAAARDALFNNVQQAVETKFPLSNNRYTLKVSDIKYRKPRRYSIAEQKRAIMRGQTLGWNLVGNWELVDNASGKVVDKTKSRVLAQVPYLTDRGTFIFNGNEYTVASQMRLRPGIYSRIKDNGIIEAHFNVRPGTGRSFRVHMEPETGVFRMDVGQANLKLYPILRAMGIEDRALNEVWGPDLLRANIAASDPRAIQRAYAKLVGRPLDEKPSEQDTDALKKAAYGAYPKADVNYTMMGTFQQCQNCRHFGGMNSCSRVQGFVAPSGWCLLWTPATFKLAQDENANRSRARFVGTIVCDDSSKDKPWIYLKVHKGLAEAAYDSLIEQKIRCEPYYDNPHITVTKWGETKALIDKYGSRWKSACGNGRRVNFSLQNAMVDLDPPTWEEMDRVWFLEARSPELRAYRKSLGLSELPEGEDGEEPFHITVAVHRAKAPRGSSKISAVFDGVEKSTADAFAALLKLADEAISDDIVKSAGAVKLADSVDLSVPAEETQEDEEPFELIERQQQAARDLRGNPAYDQVNVKQLASTMKKQRTLKQRYFTLEELKAMLPKPVEDVAKKAYEVFVGREQVAIEGLTKRADTQQYGAGLRSVFESMEVDPETTESTLGRGVKSVSPELIVDVTKKLVGISRREAETDDRDSVAYQRIYGPEDLFANQVARDAGGTLRKLLWRATLKSNVSKLPSGPLSPLMRAVLLKSGLAAPLEEVNPLEIFDQLVRVTRMGEGGMPSLDAVPDEARSVQPSHFGFIDPIRTPEGMKIGVDSRLTHGTYKGSDGSLYAKVLNAKTGKIEKVSAQKLVNSTIAFPGELEKGEHEVRAMIGGKKLSYVKREEVDYELPHTSQMFTATSNMVPLVSAIKGGRLLMGAKMSLNYDAPILYNRDGTLDIVKIGEYRHETGDTTLAIDPITKQLTWLPIKAKITHKNECGMVRVGLKSGRDIVATDSHSFVTLDESGELIEIAAGDLGVGTAIPRAGRLTFTGGTSDFHVPAGKNTVPRPARDFALDGEFGWIVGMYLAEGWAKPGGGSLDFAARTPELRQRIYDFFKQYDATPGLLKDQPFDRIRLHWTAFTNKLVEEFGMGSQHKRLPIWCFCAPLEFRKGLVAGYLAGDGGYELRRGRCRVKGGTRSKQLRDGLVLLLTTLNIDSVLREEMVVGQPFYSFVVRAEHVSLLPDTGHLEKEHRRSEYPAWSGKKSFDWMPIYYDLHSDILARTTKGSQARQRCYVQQHTKNSVREIIGDGDTTAHKWLASDVIWDRVESIAILDPADYPEVYDLDLDGNVFMCANGVFVHNSTQALPLRNTEAPLVQNLSDDGVHSFEELYGNRAGAVRARTGGFVESINKNEMKVRYDDGQVETHDLYDNFPFNRKTFVYNTPLVKIGDRVEADQLLAKSNFTDDTGAVAVGLNLRIAYMPYRGYNADDAIVISESAAKKLSSEHMYTTNYKEAENYETGKRAFVSLFPGTFDKKQMETINSDGVVKVGTKVNYGDPLVLAVASRKPTGAGMLRPHRAMNTDASLTWEHDSEGEVVDVDKTKDGWKVIVKAYSPMQIGDKLSNKFGGKGVISTIISDDKMPHDKDGKPFEVLLNPLGLISRTNPSQLIEVALGKVAKKVGKPYKVPGFVDESLIDYAKRELQKHGLSDTEDVHDPVSGRKIPKVFTGYAHLLKLHHMAEAKLSGRDVGTYTSEGIPAGSGEEGSKRIGMGEMTALISHGATNVIRDAKLVRGQRNDDFWRALRLGYTPPSPKVPMIYDKFIAHLQASGINVKKQGNTTHLFAQTDRDVSKLSAGPIGKPDTVTGDKLDPVEGGLFDVGLTGGHGGNRWAHIDLAEPLPNPVMEEPIRRMLGLTRAKLASVIAGRAEVNGETGPQALLNALKRIKLDDAIEHYSSSVREARGAERDNSIKVLGYLRALKAGGLKPSDLMVTKVPVIPPNFRPITEFNKVAMVSDPNRLYADLINTNSDLSELRNELGDKGVGNERLALYKAFEALVGLGDPVSAKSQEMGAKGFLAHVFGGSPKFGMFQRKVLGAAVDVVGRGVITPNPSLGMDQVGLPEDKAWVIYRPFVTRNLIRRGMSAMAAAHHIENQDEVARKALVDEMSKRPLLINRAPVLHRYGMMAAWPILVKGNTLQIPPIVTPGFNADFDGDAMNYHVPVSKAAVEEAVNKMLPSRNLLAVSDFNVHYFPRQEFLYGLYLASKAAKAGPPKTFASKADVLRAFKRGELHVGDKVQF